MRRTIAAIGRTLVVLGLLILLFVAYQLWGTGIFTARAQSSLKADFKREQQAYQAQHATPVTADPPVKPGETTSTTSVPQAKLVRTAPPIPAEGDVEALISIPKININMALVEGTSRDDLKKGPGHYPETPMPGTLGNAAIAGHRTTYLHPFYNINELQPGDDIIIAYANGNKFTYRMTQQLIVAPSDVAVAANTPDAELTLTSCNPRFSAAQRIVVKAVLVPNESAPVAKPNPPRQPSGNSGGDDGTLAEGLSGQSLSKSPAIMWGIIAALVGLAWWWAFRRWRHPATWLLGLIPFLVVLFPFYVYLERALPAGY